MKIYSKEYQFKEIGENNVKIILYSDLNMTNMFKGVIDLIDVEMNSDEKKCKITSMESAFEECKYLEKFNISGFNTEELKSMHKLF